MHVTVVDALMNILYATVTLMVTRTAKCVEMLTLLVLHIKVMIAI